MRLENQKNRLSSPACPIDVQNSFLLPGRCAPDILAPSSPSFSVSPLPSEVIQSFNIYSVLDKLVGNVHCHSAVNRQEMGRGEIERERK